MSSISERLAKSLKVRMNAAGLSQTALAEKTGMTVQTVNVYCNGRGKVLSHSLELMAHALGTTAEALISEDVIAPAPSGDLAQMVRLAVSEAFAEHERRHAHNPETAETLREIIQALSPLKTEEMKNALRLVRAIRAEHDAAAGTRNPARKRIRG